MNGNRDLEVRIELASLGELFAAHWPLARERRMYEQLRSMPLAFEFSAG
jgi:hypothetical protein